MKVPVPFEFVFPHGVLCLGVEPATDFDKRGQADDQARDKETGERVWLVKALDLDPEAGKFGASQRGQGQGRGPGSAGTTGPGDAGLPAGGRVHRNHSDAVRRFPAVQGHRPEVPVPARLVDPRHRNDRTQAGQQDQGRLT
jgi:hypothetical protein